MARAKKESLTSKSDAQTIIYYPEIRGTKGLYGGERYESKVP